MKKKITNLLNFLNKNKITLIIILIIIGITIKSTYSYLYKPYKINKDFQSIDLKNTQKLMIVAHPDDEMLWGGAHLIEDNYLVVCITCGTVKIRVNEFINVMNATNNKYIMLGYPDKTNGERDNWDLVYDDISKDINNIISLKDWDLIVTHNPQGEYGHIHHKLTNKITTNEVEDKTKLYYFGKYHSKKKIAQYYNTMTPINDKYYKQKLEILGLYPSQYFIQTSFDHMFGYEDWIQYENWEDDINEINE